MKHSTKASREVCKTPGRSGSKKGDPNLASEDLREIIATLRDLTAQPDSFPTGTIDLIHTAPGMTLDPSPSDVELDRVARDSRDVIIRGHSLPIFHGRSEGERSARDDPVLFRDHFEICQAYVEAGKYRLPPYVRADNRKRVTGTDRFAGCRRNMLREMVAAYLGTSYKLSSPTPVRVHRISRPRDAVPAEA